MKVMDRLPLSFEIQITSTTGQPNKKQNIPKPNASIETPEPKAAQLNHLGKNKKEKTTVFFLPGPFGPAKTQPGSIDSFGAKQPQLKQARQSEHDIHRHLNWSP